MFEYAKRWTKKSSHSKWDFSNLWMQYVIYIFSFELCINVMIKFVVLHFHYHFLLYRYRNNVNWVCCSWIHAKYYIVIFNISYNLLNISLSLSRSSVYSNSVLILSFILFVVINVHSSVRTDITLLSQRNSLVSNTIKCSCKRVLTINDTQ